jgi:hypothetical protein
MPEHLSVIRRIPRKGSVVGSVLGREGVEDQEVEGGTDRTEPGDLERLPDAGVLGSERAGQGNAPTDHIAHRIDRGCAHRDRRREDVRRSADGQRVGSVRKRERPCRDVDIHVAGRVSRERDVIASRACQRGSSIVADSQRLCHACSPICASPMARSTGLPISGVFVAMPA